MKQAAIYYGWAMLCVLLSYTFGAILPPFLPFPGAKSVLKVLAALSTLAAVVPACLGWWHFAQWVWRLLVGTKRPGRRSNRDPI